VNGEKLATGHTEDSPEREPIFKLAWSGYSNSDDPRGGSSTLSILGGRNDNASGVSVLQFAPYNPPYPPADASGTLISGLHPFFRAAMRQSVIAQDSYFYTTSTPVVDFLLIPKDSPHFGGSFDPQQIMVIMEAKGGTRSIESRVFPPPQFTQSGQVQPATSIPQADETVPSLDDDLAATIAAMGIADDPAEIELPLTFWNGKHSPNSVHIIKLERDAHNKLIRERKLEEACPFNGGEAYAEDTHDARLAKVGQIDPFMLSVIHYAISLPLTKL
jgi:syntaxin-binding protein 5